MNKWRDNLMIVCAGPLHDDLVRPRDLSGIQPTGLLRQIPGVAVGKTGDRMWVPVNALKAVVQIFDVWGLTVGQHYAIRGLERFPAPFEFESAWQKTVQRLAQSEIRDQLYSDEPPSAASPDRLLRYQREGIAWGVDRDSAALWAPTGAGKTWMAACWAACGAGAILEVTSSPQARRKHAQEVRRISRLQPFNWKPPSQVLVGDDWSTLEEYLAWCDQEPDARPYVITSWYSLPRRKDEIIERLGGRRLSVIWDELHTGKKERRVRWVIDGDDKLEAVSEGNVSAAAYDIACTAARRLGTTASPIGHRLRDLWGQLTLIEPWSWGKTSTSFLMRYCDGRPGEFAGIVADGMSHVDELKYRIRRFSTWAIDKAVTHRDLPPKRREIVRIDPKDLVKAYKWTKRYEKEVLDKKVGAAVQRGKVRQLKAQQAASMKRVFVVSDVDDWLKGMPEAKIVLFTGTRRDAEKLGDMLEKRLNGGNRKRKTPVKIWVGHGGHSQQARIEIEREYMGDREAGIEAHPGPCILVGTGAAWGESLDLQDTDLHGHVELPWTPKEVIQREGRTHRHGMRRPVLNRYYVAESTFDERVAEVLLSKLPAVAAFTGDDLDGLDNQLSGVDDLDWDDLDNIYGELD